MPYANVKITREDEPNGDVPSSDEKVRLIAGVSDVLFDFLGKDSATTVEVIDVVELGNWGFGGLPLPVFR